MRSCSGIALAVVLATLTWSCQSDVAKPNKSTVSIDPVGMTTKMTNLPIDPKVRPGHRFLPAGVHYD